MSFDLAPEKKGPVECLGMTFESDDARRAYFLEQLKEKLQDPEFRNIPGFPKGKDEDILRMSDPPYYTACPNPFLEEFVRVYGRPYDPNEEYHREPFAVDVSVGKTDALYQLHTYHTKVPHLGIVPSILHYTNPDDVVLDCFSGSGMTGLACRYCETAPIEYRRAIEQQWEAEGRPQPKWGRRLGVVSDLSPIASFISANTVTPLDTTEFREAAEDLLDRLYDELGWMYETKHTDGVSRGKINFTVWSEVFYCPGCQSEITFLKEAYDESRKSIRKSFPCPTCGLKVEKRNLVQIKDKTYDHRTGNVVGLVRRTPVLINYSVGNRTFEKNPDQEDLILLERVQALPLSSALPTYRMMHAPSEVQKWGDKWRAGSAAFTHVHHLFLQRPAVALGWLWERLQTYPQTRLRNALLFLVEQAVHTMTLQNRYQPQGFKQVNKYLPGVYYLPSNHCEVSPWYAIGARVDRVAKALAKVDAPPSVCVSTNSGTGIPLEAETVDYIFTDPPFGANFAYAELNFLLESFHGVFTDTVPEAIVSGHQGKGLEQYSTLMYECFKEYFRVLKSGRWMTVVFSNSSNAVWRSIQEALGRAGFVVANVQTLDKQQGSFNQVQGVTVDQDLVISAYKPRIGVEGWRLLQTPTPESAWSFVEEHLSNVPVFLAQQGAGTIVVERTPQVLLDRMIAFHVQRGIAVPLDAGDFFRGLEQRYAKRDGMYFLADQVHEYDRKRAKVETVKQLSFDVTDEASAILWLRVELDNKPQSFQDLQPTFMRESKTWAGHEKTVELKEILEENFLQYDGSGPVPPQIHTYLSTNFKDLRNLSKDAPTLKAKATGRWYVPDPNKQSDLDQLRSKRLLKEFQEYKESKQKKLKPFRTEAVRAGFKAAYDQKDYRTIIDVAKKLPEQVIQEDEKLLMYYDVALMRLGED